jgi:ABC-2 type transport system permease protein
MITFLPTLILSGFVFPLESMPWILQAVSYIIPARYYMTVIRGVMLAGEAWYPLEGAVMLAMSVGLLAAATRKFSSRLD